MVHLSVFGSSHYRSAKKTVGKTPVKKSWADVVKQGKRKSTGRRSTTLMNRTKARAVSNVKAVRAAKKRASATSKVTKVCRKG